MNPRNTFILVLLAAAMFAFIYFFERHIEPPVAVVVRVLPGLNTNEITSIEVDPRGQYAIRVDRTNGGWQMTKPIVYPVRGKAVDAFLDALVQLTPQRRISAEELQSHKKVNEDYGFDPPLATILIEQGDDESRLELGDPTAPGDGIYARVVGKGDVEIIGTGFAAYVPTNSSQWRDTMFVNLQGLPFVELDVAGASGQLRFQRDDVNKPWNMAFPVKARADNETINQSLDRLQHLSVNQFVIDDPNADLEQFGLQSPQLVLTFKDKNTNQLLSIQFGKSPADNPNLIYARTNSSGTIVEVPREGLGVWNAEPGRFRDPHLLSLTISEQPSSIECYGPDGRTNFVVQMINGISWVTNGEGMSFPAEPAAVLGAITQLAGMNVVPWSADRFANDAVTESELPAMGLAPNPLLRYVLRGAPAGGTTPVIAQVDFGSLDTNRDGALCARRSDLPSEQTVFAVNASDVARLPTNAVQMRLRKIWHFEATNVSHLTIQSNGQAKEWTHQSEFVWMPPSGVTDNRKGMFMENLVDNLGELEAQSWVGPAEPTADYGFTANSLQFSVTLTSQSPALILSVTFGGPVPGGDGARYGCTRMQDGKNWIFVCSARDVRELNTYMPKEQ